MVPFLRTKTHLLVVQNIKAMKEDISIAKLNVYNLHKPFISLTKSMEMLKSLSFIYFTVVIVKTVLRIIHVMPE